MIDYLTHPKFLNYDPSVLPSRQGGGGMFTKTFRVLEALRDVYPRTQGICDASEITADTVLIEPLRLWFYAAGKMLPSRGLRVWRRPKVTPVINIKDGTNE